MEEYQNIIVEYNKRINKLELIANNLVIYLNERVKCLNRIDMVSTRVKGIDSFVSKALKISSSTGLRKYPYPFDEVQDQIGARIVVYYKSDVETVAMTVLSYLSEIEDQIVKDDPNPQSFGYEARHFICEIPLEIYTKCHPPIRFFELQISTLFQHAWAQCEHDLGYKPEGHITFEDKRKIAWAAAQAWGTDQIFDELWQKSVSEKP